MPAIVVTREPFPVDTTENALKVEIDLRIRAGAIRSKVEVTQGAKILVTEWNVIGGND
jgi:hypothetical protein